MTLLPSFIYKLPRQAGAEQSPTKGHTQACREVARLQGVHSKAQAPMLPFAKLLVLVLAPAPMILTLCRALLKEEAEVVKMVVLLVLMEVVGLGLGLTV